MVNMGGNTRAIDRATGETLALADRIDLRQITRISLRRHVHKLMSVLDALFYDENGKYLWDCGKTDELLVLGEAYNGTSVHVFGMKSPTSFRVPVSELVKYKPTIGDIDITVPREKLKPLYDVLARHEFSRFTDNFTYLGQNKQQQQGHQINALFRYVRGSCKFNIQFDFEGVIYENGLPNEFAKFAHSSSWDDVKVGIKGVAHKYWLTNLVRATSEMSDAVVLTEKSPDPPNHRVKVMSGPPRMYAFSVDRGLRPKLVRLAKQLSERDGAWDKRVTFFRELKPSESKYTTDLHEIFENIFAIYPTADELKLIHSFTGLNELCEEFVPDFMIKKAYAYLIEENLFGKNAQKLSRSSPDDDFAVKEAIVNALRKKFPYLTSMDTTLEAARKEFYRNYSDA